ncbi:MAG: transporter [Methylocella sp.]
MDTFALFQGAGNLYPATGSANSKRITENFVAGLAIVGRFPDFRIFGPDLGFAVTVPFASDRNTVKFTAAAPGCPAQRCSLAGEIASITDTEYSVILGWHAGEQHWNVILTGFAPTGNILPTSGRRRA